MHDRLSPAASPGEQHAAGSDRRRIDGITTVIKTAVTMSDKRTGWLGQASKTVREFQRPLLTVDEALRMPGPEKDHEGNITKAGDMVIYLPDVRCRHIGPS